MENLAIVFLNGQIEDKEKFIQIVRNKLKYFIWQDNVNHSIASYLGWSVEDRGSYEFREFQSRLNKLANDFFDFPLGYICKKIKKASQDERCQILIFHDVSHELADKIGGECDQLVLEINLTNERKETVDGKQFEMNVNDETFEIDISTILKVLTHD